MTRPSRPARHAPLGLAWRIFAAMALVVLAGAGSLIAAALLVAPAVFQDHLRMAAPPASAEVQTHVAEAFSSAVVVAMGVGVTVALVAALAVAWLVASRLAAPVTAVAGAAQRTAEGDYSARVPQTHLGPELDRLTRSFNAMAARLDETEQVRRRLLADLAHELRTPLASIRATLEAVADGVLPMDETSMTTLTDQVARLERLVGDLSAVSRAEERRLDLHALTLSPQEVVEPAVAAARPRFATKGVRLATRPAAGSCRVHVDPDRLAEALGALLDNALRHTPAAGEVTVSVEAQGPMCALVVADTGTGFDPSTAPRLFERFYREDASRTSTGAGTGIGLTIARAIAEAHGGRLLAASDGLGTGARFTLLLPAVPA